MTKKIIWTVISCSIVLSLVLAACARQAAPPTPTTPTSAPPPAPTSLSDGESLYAQRCASCHGTNADGTTLAPAIAGHSGSALKT